MSSARYHVQRYKTTEYGPGVHTFSVWKHFNKKAEKVCEKTLVVKTACEGKYRYLKFINDDGRYCFRAFEKSINYSTNNQQDGNYYINPDSTYMSGGNTRSLGVTTTRTLILQTQYSSAEEWKYLEDLTRSKSVYLQINETPGDINDEGCNWLAVTVQSNAEFNVKKNSGTFTVSVILPQTYNLTE